MYLRVTTLVPAVGGSYTEGILKQPRTINPIYASTNDIDRDIARLIFSRMLTYTGDGSIETDLAETYEISEDGKTYTIILRKDVWWHDGVLLTADDVVFTIKTIQNPQYNSPLRPNWQGVEIEAPDLNTVVITLRNPLLQEVRAHHRDYRRV